MKTRIKKTKNILIALQINNTNELEKQRSKELQCLENIKTDLYLNIEGLNSSQAKLKFYIQNIKRRNLFLQKQKKPSNENCSVLNILKSKKITFLLLLL
jgi:uncharacterized protein YueI